MIECISDNVTSPLGWTSNENFKCIRNGETSLKRYSGKWGLPEAFVSSIFEEGVIEARFAKISPNGEHYSRFAKLAILSIHDAITQVPFDILHKKTLFIISSTKGDVELLDPIQQSKLPRQQASISLAAKQITRFFKQNATPIVVSNACISGVSAQITAKRLIERGYYDYVIVCGCDVLSKFIVSGFQSFKALSDEECRPFDKERKGLNLGEAAATIILHACNGQRINPKSWILQSTAIRNDANHISGPSRIGEGCYRALKNVLPRKKEQLAFVNVHGTATLYNDEMEAIALSRAHLTSVPMNAMKGYLGHTLGAAGILETILSMKAIENSIILPTRGFHQLGVSSSVNIVRHLGKTNEHQFIKILSGFGGCNAAVRWSNGRCRIQQRTSPKVQEYISHTIRITATDIELDHKRIPNIPTGKNRLTYLYKTFIKDYPKFYKMDGVCKLGLIAADLLLSTLAPTENISDSAIILLGSTGCLATDRQYQQTIQDQQRFFPSPAIFVYTLPNIVTGEIAIRHKIYGETAYYAIPNFDKQLFHQIITSTFDDRETNKIIGGWIQYDDEESYEVSLALYEINK